MRTLADFPHLLLQFHPTKNGDLAPERISAFSKRKLWWRCPVASDHLWAGRVDSRTKGGGCPFCAGFMASKTNSLAALAPREAKLWHPTKNGALRPKDVLAGSSRKVWWQCREDPEHEWETRVLVLGKLEIGRASCRERV